MLTKDKRMALAQAEALEAKALAYMICATFFDGPGEDDQDRRGARLEASMYLLSDLLVTATVGGAA